MIHLVPVKGNVRWSFWLVVVVFVFNYFPHPCFIYSVHFIGLSFSFPETEEEVVENFDVSSLPEEVLQNIEADSYWCMSKLLDGIQVNWFFLSVSGGVNWLMSQLWTTLRLLRNSTSVKNRGEVRFPIGEIYCKFGIVLRKEKKNCAISFIKMSACFIVVWCSRAELKSPILEACCTPQSPSVEDICSSLPSKMVSLKWWKAGLLTHF